ncbi:hypothetical protein SLA2020_044770 [Shorea laevis]
MILQNRGVECTSSCCICEQAEESHYHVFFTCHWSKQVWVGSCPFFAVSNIRNDTYLEDFLKTFLLLNREQQERVAVTLWSIWNNRNKCLFQSKCSKLASTVTRISTYLREYTVTTEMDNQIRPIEQGALAGIWQPPQGDIIKLNTDAAIPPNQHTAKLGVILRNGDSKVLGAAVRTCAFQGTALQAEIMAIEFAMQLGREFGCTKIEIESDCAQAVAIANSSDDCYLPFGAIVEDLHVKKSNFDYLCIKHVKRSCNELAHQLAHLPAPLPPWEGVWFGSLPRALCNDSNF